MTKTVLLTGATGFLGSHILSALLKNGFNVVILKRSFSDTWRIDHLMHQIKSYNIDSTPFEKVFEEQKIDIIIHTATNYGRKNESVSQLVEDNILFSLKILETASLYNTDIFFNTDTLQNRNLSDYTLSKKQFVEWLRRFSDARKIKVVNLRLEHIFGPGDNNTKFVVWLMEQMLSKRDEINLTKGEQKRDFIYIDDVVRVYLLLLRQSGILSQFSEFDIGTGEPIRIKEFVLKLKETIELVYKEPVLTKLNFGTIPYRKGEMMEVKEDVNPLFNLGWKPDITLTEGLEIVVKEFMERGKNR